MNERFRRGWHDCLTPLLRKSGVATIAFALTLGADFGFAFESNEHREVGNCAIVVATHMVNGIAAGDSQSEKNAKRVAAMKMLHPDERRGPLCRLPGDTSGVSDWWGRISSNKEIELDTAEGRRAYRNATGTKIVPYGQIAALVDSYVYPLRLVALRARQAATEGTTTPHARSYGEPPAKPEDLFDNGGELPWPEDVRALDVNDSHFRGLAVLSYLAAHKQAKFEAKEKQNYYGALVSNAIADHYLLDLFAPGHVMAARQTIPGELVLGMHDFANKVGVPFILQNPEQVGNLIAVLEYIRTHLTNLFVDSTLASVDLCSKARSSDQSAVALCVVSRQLDALNESDPWLAVDKRVLLRGDNFLTDRKMANKNEASGVETSRQYLLLLAVQVLSIMDTLFDESSPCPLPKCGGTLTAGFSAQRSAVESSPDKCPDEVPPSLGMDWVEARPCKEGESSEWRISTPQVRVCCGTYALVNVYPQLIQLSSVDNKQAASLKITDAPRTAGQGASYKYPEYDFIVGLGYQREYAKTRRSPYSAVFSLGFMVNSNSGEILDLRPVRDFKKQDSLFDNSWGTSVLSLRFDPNDVREHYGIDARVVTNFLHSPWRLGVYSRYGRYHDEEGTRRADNGVGFVAEATSTFFRFAGTIGTRGYPLLGKKNTCYGFEVGLFLPQSRVTGFGSK